MHTKKTEPNFESFCVVRFNAERQALDARASTSTSNFSPDLAACAIETKVK
jgi:hypothetical protein